MADKVEQTLERTIPELSYYKTENFFTKKELKEIMKKRREHEY